MLRRSLCFAVLATCALVPAAVAHASGPSPGVVQGGDGVVAPNGATRFLAVRAGTGTNVEAVGADGGHLFRSAYLPGSWGIPRVAFDGTAAGVSTDGSTLVLGDTAYGQPLKARSRFVALSTRTLRPLAHVDLRGDFSFDALSPDAKRLYLVQHLSVQDLTRYVVRAYDLRRGRLLPGWIADRTQRGWVMHGLPATRVTSADGRWAYTLYMQQGGFPFVHALDTERSVAHCIGIPWRGASAAVWNMRLALRDGGRSLAISWTSGRPYLAVDTSTWRISDDVRSGGSFPWWLLGAVAGVLVVALFVGVAVRRRSFNLRSSPTRPEQPARS